MRKKKKPLTHCWCQEFQFTLYQSLVKLIHANCLAGLCVIVRDDQANNLLDSVPKGSSLALWGHLSFICSAFIVCVLWGWWPILIKSAFHRLSTQYFKTICLVIVCCSLERKKGGGRFNHGRVIIFMKLCTDHTAVRIMLGMLFAKCMYSVFESLELISLD